MAPIQGIRPAVRCAERRLVKCLFPVLLLAAACGGGASTAAPVISNVTIAGSEADEILSLAGTGFGNPGLQVSLPYLGNLPNFRLFDLAQVGQGEWGYTGDANGLAYLSWSDTQIVVSGFDRSPGDAIILAVWNDSGQGATWGGNVPVTSADTPSITAVQFSGAGQNLHITVRGSGFGSAPVAMPYTGDLDHFFFEDDRTPCSGGALFNAGWTFWGELPASVVTLQYASWSDTEIQISGFSGQYGQGCATVEAGDPIAVAVFNSAAVGPGGAQTAWGGVVPSTP
jgi:hypothetical protein